MKSTAQEKHTCEVVEHLRRQGCVEEDTVADRISWEFCKALPSGH
jgi:hypothetical protein